MTVDAVKPHLAQHTMKGLSQAKGKIITIYTVSRLTGRSEPPIKGKLSDVSSKGVTVPVGIWKNHSEVEFIGKEKAIRLITTHCDSVLYRNWNLEAAMLTQNATILILLGYDTRSLLRR